MVHHLSPGPAVRPARHARRAGRMRWRRRRQRTCDRSGGAGADGVDVDVDGDGDGDGGVVTQTEEGEISMSEDGGMVIESEDGEVVSQPGPELPDDFPGVAPVLDAWEPTMWSRMVDSGMRPHGWAERPIAAERRRC